MFGPDRTYESAVTLECFEHERSDLLDLVSRGHSTAALGGTINPRVQVTNSKTRPSCAARGSQPSVSNRRPDHSLWHSTKSSGFGDPDQCALAANRE
jgi:hypothetical protein